LVQADTITRNKSKTGDELGGGGGGETETECSTLGAQEMQIKVYLESLTKNSARCRTQYTIKIRLTLSG